MSNSIKLFILAVILFSTRAFDQDTIDYFDSVAELFRVPNQTPGLGLTIVQNGENYESYSKGYGVRDRERALPVEKDTLFMIASVTKSITSILAVKVLSEKFPTLGESALDTPVIHLVPQVNFTFIDKNRHESMTMRDMLAHRTCLEFPDFQLFMGAYEDSYDYIYRSRYAQEICQFRSEFKYNNVIYDLAGQIIGMIAGKPYKDIAQEFFNELGMSRTTYVSPNWNKEPNTAQAYYRTVTDPENPIKLLDPLTLDRFTILEGTGGILSCAEDMEKYVSFHIFKGKVGDKVVVPENVLNWVYRPSIKNGNEDYALGLGIGTYFDGTPFISHGGNAPPFEGMFSFLPSHEMGIYSVINGPGELQDWAHIHLHIAIYNHLLSKSTNYTMNKQKSLPVFTEMIKKNQVLTTLNEISQMENSSIEPIVNFMGLFGNAYWSNIEIGWDGNLYTFTFGKYSQAVLLQFEDPAYPNYYWISWTSDVSYMEAWMGAGKVPPYYVHVKDIDTLSLHGAADFKRDATRETFPEIPWQ